MMGNLGPHKILVVDDDQPSRRALEIPLRFSGYDVTTASGGVESIRLGKEQHFDLVLTDVYMPDLGGLEVLRSFRTFSPETRVIVMTGLGSLDLALQAVKEGAFEFIAKPYRIEDLLNLIERAVRHSQVVTCNAPETVALSSNLPLIGHSQQMVSAYKLTAQAAHSDATVLIEGESGTGKELIARAIHSHGHRSAQPFTAVNCSALTETLLESELFGYMKGSFTGASTDRPGLFESSNGGTIFLDELGSTSLAFQSSLLRVLQEKEVRRIGSHHPRTVDVRVIGATNCNLEELIPEGKFRADLFYRISVLTIHLPPLRERGAEDISLLAHHFLGRLARNGKELVRISSGALDVLTHYQWPGNVRELENSISHAAAVCAGNIITENDLPRRIVERVLPREMTTFAPPFTRSILDDRPSLAELERRYAMLIIAENGGNKSRAAEILGIDRRTVYRLLEIQEEAGEVRSQDRAHQN